MKGSAFYLYSLSGGHHRNLLVVLDTLPSQMRTLAVPRTVEVSGCWTWRLHMHAPCRSHNRCILLMLDMSAPQGPTMVGLITVVLSLC